MVSSDQFRREVLASYGATLDEQQELLAYNQSRFEYERAAGLHFPLADEPFIESWIQYAEECEQAGSIRPLKRHLVQLCFPVAAGVSSSPEYRAALTQSAIDLQSSGLAFKAPELCRLSIHATPAGRIPLLVAGERADFVSLVRALSKKNEPVEIPGSMGACMISGYRRGESRDRFVILSDGPYSGVSADRMGLSDEHWRAMSLAIRREHECTHYFTRRVLGSMRNNLLDELIADYMGIATVLGRFNPEWFLLFMGIKNGRYSTAEGRFRNYLLDPPISRGAADCLCRLLADASRNLATLLDPGFDANKGHAHTAGMILRLSRFTLEELACYDPQSLQLSVAGSG